MPTSLAYAMLSIEIEHVKIVQLARKYKYNIGELRECESPRIILYFQYSAIREVIKTAFLRSG